MKKAWIVVAPLFLAACGSGIASMASGGLSDGETIGDSAATIESFASVALLGPDNVVFTTGDSYSIKAEGDAEAIAKLRYKLDGDTLKIGRKSQGASWSSDDGVTVYITAPALSEAVLAGSGDMTIDRLSGEATKVSIAGSGNIDIAAIESDSLDAKIAGSGNLKAVGAAKSADIKVAGSGDIAAAGLKVESAKISVAGSGNVAIASDGSVKATTLGSGDITITGSATCKSNSMGSGNINCG